MGKYPLTLAGVAGGHTLNPAAVVATGACITIVSTVGDGGDL